MLHPCLRLLTPIFVRNSSGSRIAPLSNYDGELFTIVAADRTNIKIKISSLQAQSYRIARSRKYQNDIKRKEESALINIEYSILHSVIILALAYSVRSQMKMDKVRI